VGFSAPALTAGLRYTQEKKSFTPNEFVVNSKGGPFPNGLPVLPSTPVKRTFSKATPLAATPTFDPETVTSSEVGFKTSTWEDKLHINAAAYLTNDDDIQVSVFQAIAPSPRTAAPEGSGDWNSRRRFRRGPAGISRATQGSPTPTTPRFCRALRTSN
jgi:outer membrane receptor protein involved in Fe transport